MKKQKIFISFVKQTELGIYVPSEEVERKPTNIAYNEDTEDYQAIIKVQGKIIDVVSDNGIDDFDVNMPANRRRIKLGLQ